MILRDRPTYDGTVESTVAWLDAWLAEGRLDPLEDALASAEAHLEEALSCVGGLGSAEECDNEECTKSGDVEYLGAELREALGKVQEADDAVDLLAAEQVAS